MKIATWIIVLFLTFTAASCHRGTDNDMAADAPLSFDVTDTIVVHAFTSTVLSADSFSLDSLTLESLCETVRGRSALFQAGPLKEALQEAASANTSPEAIHMIMPAAMELFRWNGDKDFLGSLYEKCLNIPDRTLGNGLLDTGGIDVEETIDLVTMDALYFKAMSEAADIFGDGVRCAMFHDRARHIVDLINGTWWNPRARQFSEFTSDISTALKVIGWAEDTYVDPMKSHWAVASGEDFRSRIDENTEQSKGFKVFNSYLALLPERYGISDEDIAAEAIGLIPFFSNKYGIYRIGIQRQDLCDLDETSSGSPKVSAIATGYAAIAECRYRDFEKSVKYIELLDNSIRAGVVNPEDIMAVGIPVVHYLFGISPDAVSGTVEIAPDIPGQWDYAAISGIRIGEGSIGVTYQRKGIKETYIIASSNPLLKITLKCSQDSHELTGKKRYIINHSNK